MIRALRIRIPVVLALAASVAAAPASVPASASARQTAPSSFAFYGSGFGHGVGMSQWGAYGLAKKGWTHQQILTHYYSNTTLGKSTSEPSKIRVGLVDGVQYVHVAAVGGLVKLQTGAPDTSGTVVATVPAGSSYLVKGGTGNYVIVDGNGTQVAGPIDGSKKLYANYTSSNAKLRSAEAGHTYNRGFVELNDYRPCSGCGPRLRLVAVLSPQEYLYGLG